MGDAFGRRTGIRRKKNREKNKCARFLLFLSHFPRERPRCETHGGHSRSNTAQGPSNTCVRPGQGTGSRPGFSGALFSAPVRLIKPHEVVYFYVSNSPGATLHTSMSGRALASEIPHGPPNNFIWPSGGHGSRRRRLRGTPFLASEYLAAALSIQAKP